MSTPLLHIDKLQITFPHRFGDFTAVDNFSMQVSRGEIVGLIGESGAGKSTVGNAVMGLLAHPGVVSQGQIKLDEESLTQLDSSSMAMLRGRRIGMIFQDPMTSLNPLMKVGDQLSESIAILQGLSASAARSLACEQLVAVGIPDPATRMRQYPHEFSGGMRQRVVIALALAGEPDLLIADEPTTALDVTVQKQVLDLVKGICRDRQLGVVLVTHDMGVIAQTADRVYVMRHGSLVESGLTGELLRDPVEPYTRELIGAIPRMDCREERFRNPVSRGGEIDTWLRQDENNLEGGNYLSSTPLTKDFEIRKSGLFASKGLFRAVDSPALSIKRGEVLGLVGESGSGKSTLGRLLTGLLKPNSGDIEFADHGLLSALKGTDRRKAFRRDIQVIFQDPYSSLNGRMRIDRILAEPIVFHGLASKRKVPHLVTALLERVGLPADAARKHPHQFSGGQRQRICIARALAVRPRFLLCDEPTSALDVSIQADMLALLMELKQSLGLTMLFVSHDLAVVRQVSDQIAVMRNSQFVECGPSEKVFNSPASAYTRLLLDTAPRLDQHTKPQLQH